MLLVPSVFKISQCTRQLGMPDSLELIFDTKLWQVSQIWQQSYKFAWHYKWRIVKLKETFPNYQQQKTTRLEKRLYCLFILSTENDITKSLSYKEGIKRHADKECRKEVLQKRVRKLFNEHTVLLFWIFS